MGETFENDGKTVAFTIEKYVFKGPERQNLLQNHLRRIKITSSFEQRCVQKEDV